jgi:hypothetical protein
MIIAEELGTKFFFIGKGFSAGARLGRRKRL